jgi:hypothetical protein
MPPVGFETTTPVFERAKTDLALDRSATVIGHKTEILVKNPTSHDTEYKYAA